MARDWMAEGRSKLVRYDVPVSEDTTEEVRRKAHVVEVVVHLVPVRLNLTVGELNIAGDGGILGTGQHITDVRRHVR